ncbi:MAG: NAD(P)-dependent oxidoreductase [Candidatus Heimdallarchaeota archaeon]|nr:MAG: NAD(P)-dependent oxidoreductase [Candidatus Heimdallarchaeota archaeon]
MKSKAKAVKMTLLITGGTGLVGQTLIRYLVEKTEYGKEPDKIRLLIRNNRGNPYRQRFLLWCEEKNIDLVYGDLKTEKDVAAFTRVSDPQSSILIHSGAIFNLWQPFELLYEVNVKGTKRILTAFHENKIKKLIFISSVAVYGSQTSTNGRSITEDQPIDLNRTHYELTKAIGDNLVQKYQKKYSKKLITILRPTAIVGGGGATLDLFSRMFLGNFVTLPRGGQDKISLVDVSDVARAIIFFSDFQKGNGQTFNLVSFTTTVREFTQELGITLHKSKISILSIPLFIFKPMYHFARSFRRIKPAKEKSILIPTLFDKLGQDIWINSEKVKLAGFTSNVTLKESMKKFGTFINKNSWYARQKFGITL